MARAVVRFGGTLGQAQLAAEALNMRTSSKAELHKLAGKRARCRAAALRLTSEGVQ